MQTVDELTCPTCGDANPAGARLCGMCGSSLTRDEAAGEVRRVITLVTSDLKGSTALGERLDPEALREVLNRYFGVMRAVFESHGGTIEKIIGDAIVAVYGLPFRHDDDPLRALEAAAESQRALAMLNDELDSSYGVRLVVRTGVATGEVTFGAAEAGQHVLLGPPVEVSTAMEQNSPPQEVLVHESTRDLVGDAAEFEALPPVSPKGSDELLNGFRLVSVRERTGEDEAVEPDAQPGMRICPSCGDQTPDRMRFCNTCGAALIASTAPESRRTVTIVFSMPRVHAPSGEEPGPDTMRDVMSRYFEGMRGALERHGGTVEKFIGDAVMAVFGLPVRHEDDAVRAIRAAADMQTALATLNPVFRDEYGIELSNHTGVNSGEVIAGDASTAQRMVTGDAVNTAARLEQTARSGDVVLGDLTYRLARDQIEVEFMEPLVLKGKAEPVPAYRLVRVSSQATVEASSGTPFVGREAEMGRLSGSLEEAITTHRARLVTVVGDAGVGKSRLIKEFATAAAERARLVRGRCLPYGDGITFWPLAEVIREAAGITNEDSPRIATRRLDLLLQKGGAEDREAIVERVAAAINLSAAQFPVAELMWGGRRLLETLAAQRPLVMLVDDLHWAEPTFLDFLDHLLETVEDASILILGSARHEIAERHADWSSGHEAMLVKLEPLSEADAGKIVQELLGSLEASVRERIATAAEGNPLYVEQIVSMLVETGAIQRGLEGWVAREGSAQLQIPPTVQALVASRLDALKLEERAVVDPASVIGLSFPMDAVAELVDEPVRPRLGADLDVLVTKQLVRRLPDDDVIYRFGHQIIRDTAYGSLLKRSRALLHERFVTWAERTNRERGRELEFEEILGYHLEQAYRYRESLGVIDAEALAVAERAAEKLSNAGLRALARGDSPAASSLLRRAIDLYPAADPRRLILVPDLGETLITLSKFEEAESVLAAALEIARTAGDRRAAARIEVTRMLIDLFSGLETGREVTVEGAQALLGTFAEIGDDGGAARAWRVLLFVHGNAGHYDDMAAAAEQVVELATRAGEDRLVRSGAAVYTTAAVLGSTPVDQAIERCEQILERVRGARRSEAIVLGALAQLRAMTGEFETARDLYRREQEYLGTLGPSRELASTSLDSGRVEMLAGDLDAAERELRRDDQDLEDLHETYFRSTVSALLARVLLFAGKPTEADRYATIAQALTDESDVDGAVLWRLTRSRLLARIDQEAAIVMADEAVALAARTEGVILQADSLRSRADLLDDLGRTDEAAASRVDAIRKYELKGDRVSAAAARTRTGLESEVAEAR
ncbi:MAG TPA: adenylate/guanylate cyclase domain-containing protein [Candidatus Dormibacteraeota bacterium]|nr:adenylate/guanylate cyclase domain-containing protein [Candidatus Dormibacteraeota bacterium]